jgi:hypothetical protein
MTSTLEQGSISVTQSAPHEPDISTEHEYTDVLYMLLPDSFDNSVLSMIGSMLPGCGRIDLVSLAVTYTCTAEKQEVMAGIKASGASATAEQLAFKDNGIYHVSNGFNFGVKSTFEVVPEDTLSVQIQPVSSMLPTPHFVFKKSRGVKASVILRLKVHGIRIQYGSLN